MKQHLTCKQLREMTDKLYDFRKSLKDHYRATDEERSVYYQEALNNISTAIEGIDMALKALAQ